MKKEDLIQGCFYFIKDSYFNKVRDPHVMRNHGKTMRPHLYLFLDISEDYVFMAPASSKTAKYDAIVKNLKSEIRKSTDEQRIKNLNNKLLGYYKCIVGGRDDYILLFDMIPVSLKYITRQYIGKNGLSICINSNEIQNLDTQAKKVYKLIKEGFKFMETGQPDFDQIEKIVTDNINDLKKIPNR